MPINPLSNVARLVQHPRDVTDRRNPQAWGLCVHTTGSGVPTRAKKLGIDPMEVALSVYLAPDGPGTFTNFPHYVIGSTEGLIVQIAGDNERARHAGIDQKDRQLYLSGAWRKKVSEKVLRMWERKWGSTSSPLHLFPSTSVNEDYLGVEIIPALKRFPNGSLFSSKQYDALALLIRDIENRHKITLLHHRLVGHEDLEPLTRWTSKEGWDPGGLSDDPKFLWPEVIRRLKF